MKRESKIISLVVAAIVLVAVLSFSLSTLMKNGTSLKGDVTGTHSLASEEQTTTYKDWSESTELDNEYSYSTLYYTEDTEFYVNLANADHVNKAGIAFSGNYYVDGKVTPAVRLWYPSDVAQLIITNCGYDQQGNPLSAVLEVSISKTYRSSAALNPEYDETDGKMYYMDGDERTELTAPLAAIGLSYTVIQNVTDDGKVVFTGKTTTEGETPHTTSYMTKLNMPLAFNLNTEAGVTDVKITYYKKLKLTDWDIVNGVKVAHVDTAKSQIATSITHVNSAYNDFDTTPNSFSDPDNVISRATEAGVTFEAKEGMKPLKGTSTLFYNKSGKKTLTPNDYVNTFIPQANKSTWNFRMTEKANGIFINPDLSQEDKLHGKYYNLIYRLMEQGKTRKEAIDYYCTYQAKCNTAYDNNINKIDSDTATDEEKRAQRAIYNQIYNESESYYATAGFSYLTSAQLLTTGLAGEFSFRYEMPGGGIKFGFLSPTGYKFPNPKKGVSDQNVEVGKIGYFTVSQAIPNNNVTNSVGFNKIYPNVFSSNNHITSYTFEDPVDPRLTVVKDGITIMTKSGKDITSYFDITLDENNKITATSNATASAFFNSNEAYGTTYTMSVPFMYIGEVDKYIEIPNKASVKYSVGGRAEETKETNVVKVIIGESLVNLTYDCTTNGGQAEFDPITIGVIPGTAVDLSKICVKEENRFLGWAEAATDKKAMTEFTMPDHDTTIYGLYTPSTCDTVLLSSVYKIDQTNYIIHIPYDETEATILSNVSSKGEISISGEEITVKCDGSSRIYKISRYWVAKTGNDVIRWTAIIAGTLLLGVIFFILKIRMNKKEN